MLPFVSFLLNVSTFPSLFWSDATFPLPLLLTASAACAFHLGLALASGHLSGSCVLCACGVFVSRCDSLSVSLSCSLFISLLVCFSIFISVMPICLSDSMLRRHAYLSFLFSVSLPVVSFLVSFLVASVWMYCFSFSAEGHMLLFCLHMVCVCFCCSALRCLSSAGAAGVAVLRVSVSAAGRVFPGVCVRLVSMRFYEKSLRVFDLPEMQTAPLDKLYITVAHLTKRLNAIARAAHATPTADGGTSGRSGKAQTIQGVHTPQTQQYC